MGVVRQQVKRSAGSSGFIGSISLAPHAASWIHLRIETPSITHIHIILHVPIHAHENWDEKQYTIMGISNTHTEIEIYCVCVDLPAVEGKVLVGGLRRVH